MKWLSAAATVVHLSSQIQTDVRAHFTRTNSIPVNTGFITLTGHDELVLVFNNTNNSRICASGATLTFPHCSDRVVNDKSSNLMLAFCYFSY